MFRRTAQVEDGGDAVRHVEQAQRPVDGVTSPEVDMHVRQPRNQELAAAVDLSRVPRNRNIGCGAGRHDHPVGQDHCLIGTGNAVVHRDRGDVDDGDRSWNGMRGRVLGAEYDCRQQTVAAQITHDAIPEKHTSPAGTGPYGRAWKIGG